jgi:hypothetical protein
MNDRLRTACAWMLALAACRDPTHFDATSQRAAQDASAAPTAEAGVDPPCPASAEWLPTTPASAMFMPLPHDAAECPFYRGGWQNFLIATQLDGTGEPALRSYATIDDVFQSATPHATRNTQDRAWLGDIKQAGGRQILIDQNGRAIYYGIHVNKDFQDFVTAHGLTTLAGVQGGDPTLFFPGGVVELKSAWQDIDDAPADAYADYITTTAWVPHLTQDPSTHQIAEDKNHPRQIKVALLALHVVFTLPGHPEFVWTSFQHVDRSGSPDSAPAAKDNPLLADPNNLKNGDVVSPSAALLYKAGTAANTGNQPIAEADLRLDEASQSFPGQETSIYRMFPGSKSNSIDPDGDVSSLNASVARLFAEKAPDDKRGHYRLVGGTWMDKPQLFKVDSPLQNDATNPLLTNADQPLIPQNDARTTLLGQGGSPIQDLLENGTDSPFSILAGEDRMSSTAMESFTQSPAAFPNCFSCHNTQAITARGVPLAKDGSGRKLLDPKLLNVSHVFSQFVLEETQ